MIFSRTARLLATVPALLLAASQPVCRAGPDSPAPAAAEGSTGSSLAQAEALFYEGKIDEAIAAAEPIVAADAAQLDARVLLANLYRRKAMAARAVLAGSAPETIPAEDPTVWFEKASAQLRLVLKTAPERTDVWLGLCQVARETDVIENLVACLTEAGAKFPGDPTFTFSLRDMARDFIERQDFSGAEEVLKAVSKNSPGDIPTLMALGRAQYLAGNRKQGIATMDHVLELVPENPEAHFQRAELAAFEGDFRLATIHFARNGSMENQRAAAYLGQICSLEAYDRAGALRAARAAYNRWRTFKKDRTNLLTLGLLQEVRGLLEQPNPTATDMLHFARALTTSDQLSAAVGQLTAVIAIDPALTDAHFLMAEVRGRIGQHEQAVASLTKAIDLSARHPNDASGVTRDELFRALGTEYLRLAKYQEALDAFSKCSRTDPITFEIGVAEDHLGRKLDAAKKFRQVLLANEDPNKVAEARRYLSSPDYKNLK